MVMAYELVSLDRLIYPNTKTYMLCALSGCGMLRDCNFPFFAHSFEIY